VLTDSGLRAQSFGVERPFDCAARNRIANNNLVPIASDDDALSRHAKERTPSPRNEQDAPADTANDSKDPIKRYPDHNRTFVVASGVLREASAIVPSNLVIMLTSRSA
jgi:hypothetical protein